jgi:hypothetical protein
MLDYLGSTNVYSPPVIFLRSQNALIVGKVGKTVNRYEFTSNLQRSISEEANGREKVKGSVCVSVKLLKLCLIITLLRHTSPQLLQHVSQVRTYSMDAKSNKI